MYNDPSGEFAFLIPIITKIAIGALYGAVIGAGVAAITYSIKGLVTGNWSLQGFGKAILNGAIAGAIAGGLNGFGASVFSTNSFMLNSGTWDLLSNMITGVIQDGKIDFANIGSSFIGAVVGQKLPKWKGLSGEGVKGWLKNASGELLSETLKGGVTGSISGGFNALFRGENVWKGMKKGFENGIYNGMGQAAFMIGTFGATYKPSEDQLKYVKKMSEKYSVDYKNVKWRKGGMYQILQPIWSAGYQREVVWGNNVATFGMTDKNTFGHEFGHIIQVRNQGWSNFQARGIWEQLFYGEKSYRIEGFNEFDAEQMLRSAGGRTY